MPIQFDKFDQSKVDNLKHHLELMASKGEDQAKYYEIFVDNLKAVPKTNMTAEFDNYEKYMAPDTVQLKIVIYNSGASPRNDQYVFMFKAQNREEAMDIGLNGMPLKTFSYNDISEWREKNAKKTAEQIEIKRLKGEISELKGLLNEKEDEIIEKIKEAAQYRKDASKGSLQVGAVLGSLADTFMRKNPGAVSKLPLLGELAGLMGDNATENQPVQLPTEASFKKKDQAATEQQAISERDKHWLDFGHELQRQFSEAEFEQVIEILSLLSKDKSELTGVIDFLEKEPEEEEREEEQN